MAGEFQTEGNSGKWEELFKFFSGNSLSRIEVERKATEVASAAERIPPNPNILDYGSGKGWVGVALAKKMNAKSLTLADLDPNRRAEVLKDLPFIHVKEGNQPVNISSKFDLILLSDVLQHVDQEVRASLLTGLADCLTAAGKIFIVTYQSRAIPVIREWEAQTFSPSALESDLKDKFIFLYLEG